MSLHFQISGHRLDVRGPVFLYCGLRPLKGKLKFLIAGIELLDRGAPIFR